MKKNLALALALVLATTAHAQVLDVKQGNVTYRYNAKDCGEMTYNNGSSLTIGGRTYALSDVDFISMNSAISKAKSVREWFISEINKIEGAKAYQSDSNFVFIKLEHANPYVIRAFMEENGILIRLFTDKDALRLRITIGPKEIMERVLIQLRKALGESENE